MFKNNNVLLLGDSHTYGDGLDDVGHTEPWKEHSIKTWAYHIFDKEQIENKSYPGCCNDIISLKLIRHTLEIDLVLIMFTYPERLHIIRNGYNFIASHNFNQSISDNGDENWIAKQLATKFENQNKNLIIENFDDNFLEILFLKNILLCQCFCQSNNIDYYFTMVDFREKTKCIGSLQKYRDGLYNSINWNRIFLVDGKYGFLNYATYIKADRGLDNQHWGQAYHKIFGKLFLNFIEEDRKKQKNQL
jgi:hypothetical protein